MIASDARCPSSEGLAASAQLRDFVRVLGAMRGNGTSFLAEACAR